MKPQRLEGGGMWVAIALVVLGGVSVFVGTGVAGLSGKGVAPLKAQQPDTVMGRPECPGEGVTLRVDTGQSPPVPFVVRHVPLSDLITNIPEFHDCQRFVVKDSEGTLVYDSLFAVFASFRLNILITDLRNSKDTFTITAADTGGAGGGAGVVVRTVPVATVFSDHRDYKPLGIAPGFNCLLVYQLPAPHAWGAKMIPLTPPDSNCGSLDPHRTGTFLQVRASSTPRLIESDYPATARWDWDSVHAEQYVGIKCGAAWCQVGRFGFDTSASYTGPVLPFRPIVSTSFATNKARRVTAVRGWYDEEPLDTGGSKPSVLRGILVPNPDIHNLLKTPDRYQARWVQVGYAVVIGGAYRKWNYRREVNEVRVCHGSAKVCSLNNAGVYNRIMSQTPEPPSRMQPMRCASGWLAAVGSHIDGPFPDSQAKYFCLAATSHEGELNALNAKFPNLASSIPGTARWRWLVPDQGGWFGCISSSCCTKQ